MTSSLHRQRRKQHLGLLGMAFVFLLQTLAWTGMPVYASDADEDWVVVCTSEGIKRISLDKSGIPRDASSQDAPSPTLADHCDLCVFAQGLGMAPAPVHVSGSAKRVPISCLRTPDYVVSGKSYTPQQPRAPPVHEWI